MATVRSILHNRTDNKIKLSDNPEFPILVRIGHKSKTADIKTGYSAKTTQWNKGTKKDGGSIKRNHPDYLQIDSVLDNIKADAKKYISDNQPVLDHLDVYQLRDAIVKYRKEKVLQANQQIADLIENSELNLKACTLLKLYDDVKQEYISKKQWSPKNRLKTLFNSLYRYLDGSDINLKLINYDFLINYERFLKEGDIDKKQKPLGKNTIATYMKMLRRMYNFAITSQKYETTIADYPFCLNGRKDAFKYQIKEQRTVKRALSKDVIKEIMELDLEKESKEWHAKNFFLFQYFCRAAVLHIRP